MNFTTLGAIAYEAARESITKTRPVPDDWFERSWNAAADAIVAEIEKEKLTGVHANDV